MQVDQFYLQLRRSHWHLPVSGRSTVDDCCHTYTFAWLLLSLSLKSLQYAGEREAARRKGHSCQMAGGHESPHCLNAARL